MQPLCHVFALWLRWSRSLTTCIRLLFLRQRQPYAIRAPSAVKLNAEFQCLDRSWTLRHVLRHTHTHTSREAFFVLLC